MRVPGIVFASRSLLSDECGDIALAQVANVAMLPGIVSGGNAATILGAARRCRSVPTVAGQR